VNCWDELLHALEGEPVDLVEFIRTERERLTLKPSRGHSGLGVVLGWEVDDTTWDSVLTGALGEDFVVQERVDIPSVEFPALEPSAPARRYFADRNPFLGLGRMTGALCRVSARETINVAAGGGVIPTFAVAPRTS
jgi:hypothetical protein